MDLRILCTITLIVFVGIFLLATYLCIPKAVVWWRLWKKTGKTIHFSNAMTAGIAALFLILTDLVVFLRVIWRLHA